MTVASNQFQNHNQLLRHGMLNWVTRGVFLGYQRNYLEVQVDDLFLGDDAWDPATNTTNYDPAAREPDDARRRRPRDRLEPGPRRAPGLRLQRRRQRPLPRADRRRERPAHGQVQPARRAAARSASSTTPTSTRTSTARRRPYITRQITRNLTWAQSRGITVASPGELITGEHSGLANSRPGNPGTIDPPSFDDIESPRPAAPCPAGTYDYALTASSPAGETGGVDVVAGIAVEPPAASTRASAPSATRSTYNLYRSAGGRRRVDARREPARAARPLRPTTARTRSSSRSPTSSRPATAGAPPAANAATLAPYAQNPNFLAGITAAGITHDASDASKAYPRPDGSQRAPPADVLRRRRPGRAALPEQRLLQRLAPGASSSTSTTGSTSRRRRRRLRADRERHDVPHDARDLGRVRDQREPGHVPPRRRQRSAAALHPPEQPRRLQPGAAGDRTRTRAASRTRCSAASSTRYEAAFDRASAPLVQLTHTQIGQTLAQQNAWAANRSGHGVAAGRPRARQERGHGRGGRAAHRHDRGRALRRPEGRAGSRSRRAPSRCWTRAIRPTPPRPR